jgi:hypothetical protein
MLPTQYNIPTVLTRNSRFGDQKCMAWDVWSRACNLGGTPASEYFGLTLQIPCIHAVSSVSTPGPYPPPFGLRVDTVLTRMSTITASPLLPLPSPRDPLIANQRQP